MLINLLLSLFIGLGGAWVIMRYGYYLGLIDKPNHRSSHSIETPKGGGIGILIAFFAAALWGGSSWALWLPALVLSFFSLYGDRLHLSQILRLTVQLFCAGILIWFAARNNCAALSASTGLPVILVVLAFMLMITGTANYYNFMDGINGIAAITGLVAFGFLAAATHKADMADISVICIAVCGACIGFLILNLAGKVFMGDGGSVLLGFLFAATAIMLSGSVLDIFCYFAFIFPFYADELISVIVRLKNRQSLFKPHRGHLYQLLANELKFQHWKVSIAYGLVQTVIILSVQKIRDYGLIWVLAAEIFFFLIFAAAYATVVNVVKRKTQIQ